MGHSNCDKCGHDTKMCDCADTYVAQEGGDHYQAEYQHWDWVVDAEIGYLCGNATKYLSRWRKKNGLEDLKKSLTYLDKMIATRKNADWHYRESRWKTNKMTERFIEVNGIGEQEARSSAFWPDPVRRKCSGWQKNAWRRLSRVLREPPVRGNG